MPDFSVPGLGGVARRYFFNKILHQEGNVYPFLSCFDLPAILLISGLGIHSADSRTPQFMIIKSTDFQRPFF